MFNKNDKYVISFTVVSVIKVVFKGKGAPVPQPTESLPSNRSFFSSRSWVYILFLISCYTINTQ